jgi:thiamine transport system permease protein
LRSLSILALTLIATCIIAGVAPVLALGLSSPAEVFDSYILKVTQFTLLQAGLSTLLSLALGIPVARALARRRFAGHAMAVRLLSLPLALPAIVAVLGLVAIFGANGVFGGLFNLYGLIGILLAHMFFNLPLVARLALARLDAIPAESHRLAAQLAFTDRDVWRHVDRPALLTMLPGTALLVFLLCAASFTVVLILGGGPQATTLEVAIYQALRFDFDPARATILALVQLALCAVLFLLAQKLPASGANWPGLGRGVARYDGQSAASRRADGAALAIGFIVLLPPIAAIVIAGVAGAFLSGTLMKATATSFAIGLAAAALSFLLCWPIAQHGARSRRASRFANAAVLGAFILPPAVVATGWFIVLSRHASVTGLAPVLVVVMNALMALPFVYGALAPAARQAAEANDRLCASLGIRGFSRFRLIDLPVLRRAIGLSLVMGFIVSLGDLTAILLFGAEDFFTLPALLYQQMGSYRMEGSAFTALVLTVLSFLLILLADRWGRTDD